MRLSVHNQSSDYLILGSIRIFKAGDHCSQGNLRSVSSGTLFVRSMMLSVLRLGKKVITIPHIPYHKALGIYTTFTLASVTRSAAYDDLQLAVCPHTTAGIVVELQYNAIFDGVLVFQWRCRSALLILPPFLSSNQQFK